MLRIYGLFTYMKGAKWLHEQGEMAVGKYSRPMGHLGFEKYAKVEMNSSSPNRDE